MDLVQKGASAELPTLKQLLVKLLWSMAADFDLAAVYQQKSGEYGAVYFGSKGDLNAFPFMRLSGDEGVGDKGGSNEESMRISKLDDMAKVWLLVWDYPKVLNGEPARFTGSDAKITITTDKGENFAVSLDTGDAGNIAVIATVTVTAIGATLSNESKAGILKGFKTLDQLVQFVNS